MPACVGKKPAVNIKQAGRCACRIAEATWQAPGTSLGQMNGECFVFSHQALFMLVMPIRSKAMTVPKGNGRFRVGERCRLARHGPFFSEKCLGSRSDSPETGENPSGNEDPHASCLQRTAPWREDLAGMRLSARADARNGKHKTPSPKKPIVIGSAGQTKAGDLET